MTDADKLVGFALDAMKHAYAPYSGFFVGAALLSDDGKIYTGANVENAAYPIGCCAERSALFAAVSDGKRKFHAIAIAGGKGGAVTAPCPPCGMCRQALAEFCPPDFPVYLATPDGYEKHTLGDLLPLTFTSEIL